MRDFIRGGLFSIGISLCMIGCFQATRAMAFYDVLTCKGRGGSSPPTCAGLPEPCPDTACTRDGTTNKCHCPGPE